jgi:hypothetical protein
MARKKKNMVRTWKPMAVGFFSIISGSVAIGRGSETMVGIVAAQYPGFLDSGLLRPVLIGIGVVAIAGGVCALLKKAWGMALAGAILAVPCVVPLGVLAILWVYQSKKEFAGQVNTF